VYYTLDCSDPSSNATEYKEPIYLDDASQHENVYSMRTDVSVGFYEKLINDNKGGSIPGYVQPDYLVDKCNVVRAIAIDDKGNSSKIETGSFFVCNSIENYNGCNIISIVTSPDNLFGYENGIYVTGSIFDKYINNINMDYYGKNWRIWDANYRQHGIEWEKEAQFDFISIDGVIYTKIGGIRTQGNYSRATIPRGINLYARESYDGNGFFDIELCGRNYLDSVTLASGGNQLVTQFNDYMMSQRTSSLNFATMLYEPYVLFLEGEYWGFYWMATKYDETYISNKYGVDKASVLIVKKSTTSARESGEYNKLYCSMINFIRSNDMSDMENYNESCKMIDIDSFIDYYATQIYIARNDDWPISNFALWRTTDISDNKYSDGKWRWMLFDSNSKSMDISYIEHNTLEYVIEKDSVFASLWENESFKEKFHDRIIEIADECFDSVEMDEFIDNYTKRMYPILSKSWKRFYGSDNNKADEYYTSMSSYKAFFEGRKEVVESWFEN
jgi:hypothetical protein